MTPVIRAESPDDIAAIHALTKRAFAPMPYSEGDEQDLIDALRAAGALTISLVAVAEQTAVGHIAFSPASVAGWYALGPIAVEPALQRRGIGTLLVNAGLRSLRMRRASGCILVGNPAYYGRFGFKPCPHLAPPGHPAEYFMMLGLAAEPKDVVGFHPALGGHP